METSINIKGIPVSYVEKLDKIAAHMCDVRGEKVSRNQLLIEIIAYEIDQNKLVRLEEKFEHNTKKVEVLLGSLVDQISLMNKSSVELTTLLIENSTAAVK